MALCLSLLGAREVAAADPSWLELRWPELAGCPMRVEVEATIVRLTDGEAPRPVSLTWRSTSGSSVAIMRVSQRRRKAGAAEAWVKSLRSSSITRGTEAWTISA